MMFIAARRSESQTWVIIGPCAWERRERLRPGRLPGSRGAYMKVAEQRKPYKWEVPEFKSCFFDAHKVIEAKDQEEAQKLC